MSLLTIRPYLPGDEALVALREDFARAFAAAGHVLPAGPAWSVLAIERPLRVLAVGGLEPCGDGCWGGWALTADLAVREWAEIRRQVGDLLRRCAETYDLREVGVTAPTERPGAEALLGRIGFRRDGGPAWTGPDGQTYQPMSWRPEWTR